MPINNVVSDKITSKVLTILKSDLLGVHLAATPFQEINRGTEVAKYGKPQRVQDAAYSRTTLKTSGWNDAGGATIEINLNQKRFSHYVVDDFDIFETPAADQFIGQAAASMAQTMTGTLDAELLSGITSGTPESTTFTLSTAATDTAAEPFLNTIADGVNDIKSLVSSEALTIPQAQIFVICSGKGYWRLAKWFKTYTQGTVTAISEGRIYNERIGGVNFIQHPFLLNTYAKGLTYTAANSAAAGAAGINLDVDYDFSKLEAIIMHNEAYALPWTIVSVKNGQEPYTLNDGIVMKYKFGKGPIRSYGIKFYQNAA